MGIKIRVLIRARALGHHQIPNQLPSVAHCTLVTDSDCYFGVHKAWHLLTHVHNTNWTQLRTALTRQQSWHGASHQKLRYELIWSNASDGPNLSMNMAFSLQLWCRNIAHGTHSNLQYSWAFKTCSHLEPCAIAATEAQAVATFSSYLTVVSQFVRFCLSTSYRKIPPHTCNNSQQPWASKLKFPSGPAPLGSNGLIFTNNTVWSKWAATTAGGACYPLQMHRNDTEYMCKKCF